MEKWPIDSRILTCYYRPKPGGFCKRLFRAIEALLAAGCEVHYLAVAPFPISHPRCYFHKYPWSADRTDGALFWGIFHLLAPLLLLYLGLRYRITHSFAFGSTYGYSLQLLRSIARVPLAVFLRADIKEHHRTKGRSTALLNIELLIEALSICGASVYPVSETLRRSVSARHRLLKPRQIKVFPNDIPRTELEDAKTPALPLRLGCVGTLDRVKNLALAVRCISGICPAEARLSIYGAGPEEQALRELVEQLKVADRVEFRGWVSEAQEIWKNVDLLLFTSLHEGSPNALLEALAYGVPVLASNIPAHRELLPLDLLLPLSDVAPWRARLRDIIKRPREQIVALLKRERESVERLRFDWDAVVRQQILDSRN